MNSSQLQEHLQNLIQFLRRPSTLGFCGLLVAVVGLSVIGLREDHAAVDPLEDELLEQELLSAVGVRTAPAIPLDPEASLDPETTALDLTQDDSAPLTLPGKPGAIPEIATGPLFDSGTATVPAGPIQQAQFEQAPVTRFSPTDRARPVSSPEPIKPRVISNGPAWLSGTIE
jgi:hypothetical protein